MRNHFLRAAAGPKPIKFIDAVANSAEYFVTSELSVSTGDFVFIFSSGTQADSNQLTANSTATISRATTTNTSNNGTYFIQGVGGNDDLIDSTTGSSFDHGFWSITSSGVLRFEDTGDRDVAGFMVALEGINTSNFGVDVQSSRLTLGSSNATLSFTGIGEEDLLLYIETIQDGPTENTLPSGFTHAIGSFGEDWTQGAGGASEKWSVRIAYLENPGSTFSHTVTAPDTLDRYKGTLILRIYNL